MQMEGQYFPINLISSSSVPKELDVNDSVIPPQLKPSSAHLNDFILLAEFSEVEGPLPLITIPKVPPFGIEINEFVVKLMSVDYQNNSSGEFRICNDIQLLHHDIEPAVHTYVHYFTLYDVQARGFVRPVCLAYISSDACKLLKYLVDLEHEFSIASQYLRISNMQIFLKEMENRLADLNYTKERLTVVTQDILREPCMDLQHRKHQRRKVEQKLKCELHHKAQGATQSLKPEEDSTYGKAHDSGKMWEYRKTSPERDHSNKYLRGISSHVSCDIDVTAVIPDFECTFDRKERAEEVMYLKQSSATNSANNVFKADSSLKMKYSVDKESLSCSHASSPASLVCTVQGSVNSSEVKGHSASHQSNGRLISDADDEKASLQHTSLEAVSVQLYECSHILGVVTDYLEKQTALQELQALLHEIHLQPEAPVCRILRTTGLIKMREEACCTDHVPSVFVNSLVRRSAGMMRGIKELSSVGYVASLAHLLKIYNKYSHSLVSLMFDDIDAMFFKNPEDSLFVGNIPVINTSSCNGTRLNPHSAGFLALPDWSRCLNDDEFMQLLCPCASHSSTPDSLYLDAVENPAGIVRAEDCLEVFSDETCFHCQASTVSCSGVHDLNAHDQSLLTSFNAVENDDAHISDKVNTHDEQFQNSLLNSGRSRNYVDAGELRTSTSASGLTKVLAVDASNNNPKMLKGADFNVLSESCNILGSNINSRLYDSKGFHLLKLLKQFSGVSHCIVNSLLTGRRVVIAATAKYRTLVLLYTHALSTFVPHKSTEKPSVLRWHTGTLTSHHLASYVIIGLCIPERLHVQDLMSIATLNQITLLNIETGHISGIAYSGSIIRDVEPYSQHNHRSSATLQAALQSTVVALGLKIYLFCYLRDGVDRSVSDILKGIGIQRGDWDIVIHLSDVVKDHLDEF